MPKVDKLLPVEYDEQVAFVQYLDAKLIPYFAIPNGGSRGKRLIKGQWISLEGLKFKRSGVKAGVPDICIPIPRKSYHGLYIEMKRIKESSISDEQRYWLDLLNKNGYLAVVCKGCDAAIKVVDDYMNIN